MLKIHSFLQRIKRFLSSLLPSSHESHKGYMLVIAYAMITFIIFMNPNYIYGLDSSYVQAMGLSILVEPTKPDVEETANEAIIRVTQPKKELQTILYNYSQSLSVGKNRNITNMLLTSNKKQTAELMANEKQVANQSVVKRNADESRIIIDNSSTNLEKNEAVATTSKSSKTIVATTELKKVKVETKANSSITRADAKTETKVETKTEQETLASVKYVINLSKNEIEILQRIVEAEATGEDVKGKMLVANVILNRVNDKEFPNTVEGVVFQKSGSTYQFSPIKDKRYWSVKISEDTKNAVERVLKGEDSSQGALYFSARTRADKTSMSWFDRNLKFLYKHGGHEFFKNK